jgi:hypothetical protein
MVGTLLANYLATGETWKWKTPAETCWAASSYLLGRSWGWTFYGVYGHPSAVFAAISQRKCILPNSRSHERFKKGKSQAEAVQAWSADTAP